MALGSAVDLAKPLTVVLSFAPATALNKLRDYEGFLYEIKTTYNLKSTNIGAKNQRNTNVV